MSFGRQMRNILTFDDIFGFSLVMMLCHRQWVFSFLDRVSPPSYVPQGIKLPRSIPTFDSIKPVSSVPARHTTQIFIHCQLCNALWLTH